MPGIYASRGGLYPVTPEVGVLKAQQTCLCLGKLRAPLVLYSFLAESGWGWNFIWNHTLAWLLPPSLPYCLHPHPISFAPHQHFIKKPTCIAKSTFRKSDPSQHWLRMGQKEMVTCSWEAGNVLGCESEGGSKARNWTTERSRLFFQLSLSFPHTCSWEDVVEIVKNLHITTT